jgi:hypothetical protein
MPPLTPSVSPAKPDDRADRRLSADVEEVLRTGISGGITVRSLEAAMRGRGFAMLVLVLATPFSVPVPLPGLSTPFGVALMILGLRMALGQKPWLPEVMLQRRLSEKTAHRLLMATKEVALRMEKVVKPRWAWMVGPRMRQILGALICLDAFVLALPLPVPLTNTFPSLAIVLMTLGLMERDGAVALGGIVLTVVAWTYVAVLGGVGWHGVNWVMGVGGLSGGGS